MRAFRPMPERMRAFLFTWPNHRIAVMGPEQLAGVMSLVRRDAAGRAGEAYGEAQDRAVRQMVEQQIGEESNAFYATARLWDDGVIDPRGTRTVLGIALFGGVQQRGRGSGHVRRVPHVGCDDAPSCGRRPR